MTQNHRRNVRGMHAAPRCEAPTAGGDPCNNAVVRGKKRCPVHGGKGADGKNYRQEKEDYKAAYLALDQQVSAVLRQFDKAVRKRERAGESADQLADLRAIRESFRLMGKQKQSDLAALYHPSEAEMLARKNHASVLDARRKYAASGHQSIEMVQDRARGAMLGLAVGEALGVTGTGWPRDGYREVTDMWGGGHFGLKPGEWAGDTAMALTLLESLNYRHCFDEVDFMERLIEWRDEGIYSCTGTCVGMGDTTREALERYKLFDDPIAGETHADCVSNGSLARLAPVAIRYWKQQLDLRDVAIRQSRTTHGGPVALQACAGFAEIMADAISGQPKAEVLVARRINDPASDQLVLVGRWRGKKRGDICSGNNALMSLEAAMWCVGVTESFEEAVLLAANLGEDAGSTAALTGQLAGAHYGACSILQHWLDRLAWYDRIVSMTDALFGQSQTRPGKVRGKSRPVK